MSATGLSASANAVSIGSRSELYDGSRSAMTPAASRPHRGSSRLFHAYAPGGLRPVVAGQAWKDAISSQRFATLDGPPRIRRHSIAQIVSGPEPAPPRLASYGRCRPRQFASGFSAVSRNATPAKRGRIPANASSQRFSFHIKFFYETKT